MHFQKKVMTKELNFICSSVSRSSVVSSNSPLETVRKSNPNPLNINRNKPFFRERHPVEVLEYNSRIKSSPNLSHLITIPFLNLTLLY